MINVVFYSIIDNLFETQSNASTNQQAIENERRKLDLVLNPFFFEENIRIEENENFI